MYWIPLGLPVVNFLFFFGILIDVYRHLFQTKTLISFSVFCVRFICDLRGSLGLRVVNKAYLQYRNIPEWWKCLIICDLLCAYSWTAGREQSIKCWNLRGRWQRLDKKRLKQAMSLRSHSLNLSRIWSSQAESCAFLSSFSTIDDRNFQYEWARASYGSIGL